MSHYSLFPVCQQVPTPPMLFNYHDPDISKIRENNIVLFVQNHRDKAMC